MAVLKAAIGPHYDLAALWDAHIFHEFQSRDVDATMATMVAEPYVNHIPTMTGGVGRRHLASFLYELFCAQQSAGYDEHSDLANGGGHTGRR